MSGEGGAAGRGGRYGGAFSSVVSGIGDLFTARRAEPLLRKEDRIDGRSCLVTGASSGLGFAVACELVRRGGRVIVASRTAGTELVERIRGAVGDTGAGVGGGGRTTGAVAAAGPAGAHTASAGSVQAEPLDLGRFESVVDFVGRLQEQEIRLDIAVFNAGVVAAQSRETPDGFDEMLQVNFLGKYLLVRKLLEGGVIAGDADPGGGAQSRGLGESGGSGAGGGARGDARPRLVFVSSEAHRSSPDIDPENPVGVEPYGMSGSMRYYGYSKLLLTTFTEELERRLNHRDGDRTDGVGPAASVLTLCPGAMNTGIAREAPAIFQPLLRGVFNLFFRSPEAAAEPVVYLAVSPEIEGRTGVYLHLTTPKEKDLRALDPETGARLWRQSAQLLRHYFAQSSPE